MRLPRSVNDTGELLFGALPTALNPCKLTALPVVDMGPSYRPGRRTVSASYVSFATAYPLSFQHPTDSYAILDTGILYLSCHQFWPVTLRRLLVLPPGLPSYNIPCERRQELPLLTSHTWRRA